MAAVNQNNDYGFSGKSVLKMRTATALWWFIDSEGNKLSTKVHKLVGTFLVLLIYVPSTESDSQAISGGI